MSVRSLSRNRRAEPPRAGGRGAAGRSGWVAAVLAALLVAFVPLAASLPHPHDFGPAPSLRHAALPTHFDLEGGGRGAIVCPICQMLAGRALACAASPGLAPPWLALGPRQVASADTLPRSLARRAPSARGPPLPS